MTFIRSTLTRMGVLMARPLAFLIVLIYLAGWAIFEPDTLDWHAYATLATWVMTLFIQRAEHRDTQAIHAKLDELLRHNPKARTSLEHEDEHEPEDIEEHRRADQEDARTA